MINFKKSNQHKKEHKKKEENVTCFECRKSSHYQTACLSLIKHHKKKDKEFYRMKGKKCQRSYNLYFLGRKRC